MGSCFAGGLESVLQKRRSHSIRTHFGPFDPWSKLLVRGLNWKYIRSLIRGYSAVYKESWPWLIWSLGPPTYLWILEHKILPFRALLHFNHATVLANPSPNRRSRQPGSLNPFTLPSATITIFVFVVSLLFADALQLKLCRALK